MLIIYGTRMYGKTQEFRGSYRGTKFFHIWYMPLFPVGSHIVFEETGDGYRGIDGKFSFASMFAGYARVWGIIGLLGSLASVAGSISTLQSDPEIGIVELVFAGFMLLLAIGALVLGWAVIGKLSTEEKQQRAVFGRFTGLHVDLAETKDLRFTLRNTVMGQFVAAAQHLAAAGYRVAVDPMTHWMQIAMDPSIGDEVIVGSAFTIAHLDASASSGPQKAEIESLRHALWKKLKHINPPYLTQLEG
jgi:hypothetical protein